MLNTADCLPLHSFCTGDFFSLFWCLQNIMSKVFARSAPPVNVQSTTDTHVQMHTYTHPHKHTDVVYTVSAQSFYLILCFMIGSSWLLVHWGFGLPCFTCALQPPLKRKREDENIFRQAPREDKALWVFHCRENNAIWHLECSSCVPCFMSPHYVLSKNYFFWLF